ncbi:MAG TPA: ATP-binding protein [Aggregatilineales bacterium]|nr:ATP-binding protein [Aggregatilineales bacterium]
MNDFTFPRLNGFQDLENFYTSFIPQLMQGKVRGAVLELSNLSFFPPEALLSLLCASRLWHRMTGHAVEWRLENEDTLRYLERMDVLSIFADCITVPTLPSDLWSRSSSANLMEVRILSDELEQNSLNDVPRILAIAQDLLLGRVTAERMGAACTLLSEVTQNVTHSGSEGYALMQIYKAGNGRRVHIAVGDTGRGIPASLRGKYPHVGQPSDYLKMSLESGITSRDIGNGLGLYQVQHLVRNGGGTLTIRSDTAMLQINEGKVYQWDKLTHIPGTQVFITIWGRHEKGEWNYLLPMP